MLRIVLKTDVSGSLEAVTNMLATLPDRRGERAFVMRLFQQCCPSAKLLEMSRVPLVRCEIISSDVGPISSSDIEFAASTNGEFLFGLCQKFSPLASVYFCLFLSAHYLFSFSAAAHIFSFNAPCPKSEQKEAETAKVPIHTFKYALTTRVDFTGDFGLLCTYLLLTLFLFAFSFSLLLFPPLSSSA